MGVEQQPLRIGAQQQLVGVLSVDVDQLVPHFAQLCQRGRGAVDKSLAAAAGIDRTPQQHRAGAIVGIVGIELALGQPGVERRVGREGGADAGAGRAFAHDAGVGPLAQHQGQGVDQDRLAGAGLAGEDGEARGEIQVERIDDDEIADGQAAQHRGGK
ncbi:hypothetical protein D3C72_1846360 [compost metagenome]